MKKTKTKKTAPLGVKILSILNWVAALGVALTLLIVVILGKDYMQEIIGSSIAILLYALMGIVFFFIGLGLWNGRQWARMAEILLAVYSIVSTLLDIFLGQFKVGFILNFVVAGIVLWYFLFNKNAKRFFNK